MSLRAKLLTLFAVFGVLPVVALGVDGYFRSLDSVEDLIRQSTGEIAARGAREIESRYALRQSDLSLFAGNAETLKLFRARAAGDSIAMLQARASAETFLRQAWDVLGAPYGSVSFRDSAGSVVHELGVRLASGVPDGVSPADDREFLTVLEPVRDPDSERGYGMVEAVVRLQTLIPREAFSASFGAEGYSVILDRANGRVLHHPSRTYLRQPLSYLLGPAGWNIDPDVLVSEIGSFAFEEGGTRRIASFVNLSNPAWTVAATGSVNEFAAPFARTRVLDLLLVILLAATLWIAFLLVTNRLVGSLTELTRAADQVSQGNLDPVLPEPGPGEVGRLTGAFGLMLQQLREMLRRIRESRHMAAVGRFASQLSHEIRNPLTAVKLNLQSLQRGVESGEIDETFAEPVAISLEEVRRLDAVVKGVLSLSRATPVQSRPFSLHASLDSALQLLQPQLAEGVVVVDLHLRATEDTVLGDSQRLRGAFLNLLLNAVEAMPDGGRIEVSTQLVDEPSGRGKIRVCVADDGPGVPHELRERIFDAFFSTKEGGTGFGLALAQQTLEEHAGRLTLEEDEVGDGGATFVVELPIGGSAVTDAVTLGGTLT